MNFLRKKINFSRGPIRKILILVSTGSLLTISCLYVFFSFYAQNSRNEFSPQSKLWNNSLSPFSNYSNGGKLVGDIYEAGYHIANGDLCPDSGKNMKLMILVMSALNNYNKRMAIRHTWSFYSRHHNVGVGFILGSYKEPSLYKRIQKEQNIYSDIIHERNVDTYENLTLKAVSILEWVDTYCSKVPFVIKSDDDLFINIPLLLSQLKKQQHAKRSIFGELAYNYSPPRRPGKGFVSKLEYKLNTWPVFALGSYWITQDSIHDLYHQALRMPFVIAEDVFMTGLLAESVGIQRILVKEFHNLPIFLNVTQQRQAISLKTHSPEKQFLLWASMVLPNESADI